MQEEHESRKGRDRAEYYGGGEELEAPRAQRQYDREDHKNQEEWGEAVDVDGPTDVSVGRVS